MTDENDKPPYGSDTTDLEGSTRTPEDLPANAVFGNRPVVPGEVPRLVLIQGGMANRVVDQVEEKPGKPEPFEKAKQRLIERLKSIEGGIEQISAILVEFCYRNRIQLSPATAGERSIPINRDYLENIIWERRTPDNNYYVVTLDHKTIICYASPTYLSGPRDSNIIANTPFHGAMPKALELTQKRVNQLIKALSQKGFKRDSTFNHKTSVRLVRKRGFRKTKEAILIGLNQRLIPIGITLDLSADDPSKQEKLKTEVNLLIIECNSGVEFFHKKLKEDMPDSLTLSYLF